MKPGLTRSSARRRPSAPRSGWPSATVRRRASGDEAGVGEVVGASLADVPPADERCRRRASRACAARRPGREETVGASSAGVRAIAEAGVDGVVGVRGESMPRRPGEAGASAGVRDRGRGRAAWSAPAGVRATTGVGGRARDRGRADEVVEVSPGCAPWTASRRGGLRKRARRRASARSKPGRRGRGGVAAERESSAGCARRAGLAADGAAVSGAATRSAAVGRGRVDSACARGASGPSSPPRCDGAGRGRARRRHRRAEDGA